MRSGHKSEIIELVSDKQKLCILILCNEIENRFFIIDALQDLLQRSGNILSFIAIRTAAY